MRKLALLPVVLLAAAAASSPAPVPSTAAIAQEVARTRHEGRRVVNVWWLPAEYWEAAARELKWPEEEIEQIRQRVELYLVLAVLDATIGGDGRFEFADHLPITERLTVKRNGEPLVALHRIDVHLAGRLPDLAYFLKASLGPLTPGLRMLMYSNADDEGKPVLFGARDGSLHARYEIKPGATPLEFFWRAPLTAIAGSRRDPKSGEPIEASWKFNPWTGNRLP